MQLNTVQRVTAETHGGQPAFGHQSDFQTLRRSVLSCLLWEREFYESGVSIAERIEKCAAKVSVKDLVAVTLEARSVHNLRHVPLLLLCELVKRGLLVDSGRRRRGASGLGGVVWVGAEAPC